MSHSLLIGFLWLHYIPATWLQKHLSAVCQFSTHSYIICLSKKFPPYSDKTEVAICSCLYFPIPVLDTIGLYFVPAGMFPCGSVLSQHSAGLGVPQIHPLPLSFSLLVTTTTTPPVFPTTPLSPSIYPGSAEKNRLSVLFVWVCVCACVLLSRYQLKTSTRR